MKRITSVKAWREILEKSNDGPILIFKYSTTCFSSLSAMKELRTFETELPIYLVVVQEDRAVSNAIEEDLAVKHESPQLLILKDGRGIWQATHYKIKKSLLNEAIHTYV